jgi:hypothetical protein
MHATQPSASPVRESRQELEEKMFAELKLAEADFRRAAADEKEAASERYRAVLDRFNTLILGRKPPACAEEHNES